MEKRIGALIIIIGEDGNISRVNEIISDHSDLILGRQGIPLRDRNTSVISLVLEGDTDRIGSLAGRLGRLEGIAVKSVLAPEC